MLFTGLLVREQSNNWWNLNCTVGGVSGVVVWWRLVASAEQILKQDLDFKVSPHRQWISQPDVKITLHSTGAVCQPGQTSFAGMYWAKSSIKNGFKLDDIFVWSWLLPCCVANTGYNGDSKCWFEGMQQQHSTHPQLVPISTISRRTLCNIVTTS